MIWVDSSFAVEWLMGSPRAAKVDLQGALLGILPMQYVETSVFFFKRGVDAAAVTRELEALDLQRPDRSELLASAHVYVEARRRRSKASLADAILASVARTRREKIISFDEDFRTLGFTLHSLGLWQAAPSL